MPAMSPLGFHGQGISPASLKESVYLSAEELLKRIVFSNGWRSRETSGEISFSIEKRREDGDSVGRQGNSSQGSRP